MRAQLIRLKPVKFSAPMPLLQTRNAPERVKPFPAKVMERNRGPPRILFVTLKRVTPVAGKTRSSPLTGATPPTQFAGLDKRLLALPSQVLVAAKPRNAAKLINPVAKA